MARPIPPGAPLRVALVLVGLALIGLHGAVAVVRNVSLQWDFQTYTAAARAALGGLDPYRPENLALVSERAGTPFVYPVLTLILFAGLAALPHAEAIWIGAKVTLMLVLLLVWFRKFVPQAGILPLALVAVFGWNASALWDIRSGNVALIECSLLWMGFTCYVAGRRAAFACLVVAAACFKLSPALFLLLLLVPTKDEPPNPTGLVASLVGLALLVAGPMLIGPGAQWEPFFAHLPPAHTLGASNPSSLGFITAVVERAGAAEPHASGLAAAIWIGCVVSLIAMSVPLLHRTWLAKDPTRWVMLSVLLYVLLSPRPMAYGFVLLTPVPFFFSPRPFHGSAGRMLLALVLAAQGLSVAANHQSDALAFVYAPFLLTLCVWGLVVISRTPSRTFPSTSVT